MTDVLDGVRDHYRATGLTGRLKTALTALGPEDQQLTPQQLGALDHFHVRGLAATAELAQLVGITADMSVLDVGSGVGGPARFLAATCGCQVMGVDLSEPFVDAARYLTGRTGQSGQVSFEDRVEIVAVETDRFPNPHSGHRKQSDQCPKRRHSVRCPQRPGCGDEGRDIRLGI
jgi:SAM-dependent methyltransferase